MTDEKDIAAVWVPIEEVQAWVKNPRKNDKAIKPVAESIKRFGFGAPLVARQADKTLIAGHTRLKAAIQLGLPRVPVRYLDVSAEDAALLAIADNRTGEIASWDDEKLAGILQELRASEQDLQRGTGLTEADIRRLIGADGSAGAKGTDPGAGAVPEVPDSKAGEIYQLGPHRLMCGSCTVTEDVAKLFGEEKASWMWTDPPYGISYVGGFKELSEKSRKASGGMTIENDGAEGLPDLLRESFAAANTALKDGSPFYICHPSLGPLSIIFGVAVVEAGWKFHQTLVWVKDNIVVGWSDYHYKHEPIIYGWKGSREDRAWFGMRDKDTLLAFACPPKNDLHPTMKPLDLVTFCLTNSAEKGSIGYEPFAGSGTTILAAQKVGAKCYAMELSPAYCDVIRKRWTGYAKSCGVDPGTGALEE